jgi:hypothetical protein
VLFCLVYEVLGSRFLAGRLSKKRRLSDFQGPYLSWMAVARGIGLDDWTDSRGSHNITFRVRLAVDWDALPKR